MVEGEGPGIRYLVFNVTKPPFDNVNLRKAVAAAVDRQAVTTEVLKGTGVPLLSMIPPTFATAYEPKWSELYGATVDKAKVDQYLAAAGVPAGQKVDLDFWFSPTHYGDTEPAVAQVLARSLDRHRPLQRQHLQRGVGRVRQQAAGGRDAAVPHGLVPRLPRRRRLPRAVRRPQRVRPGQVGGPGRCSTWSTPSRPSATRPSAPAIVKQAQAYMADQTPYVPIFQISQFAATTDKVSGVVLDPIQLLRFFLLEKA